jgi:rhodanese-related sulfurtransferase
MKKVLFYIFVLFSASSFSQKTLAELLDKHNKQAVPYISVEELAEYKTETILLDAREPEEFNVSHLKNAIYVGYDHFKLKNITQQLSDKNSKIVVYCSLGIRSEDIAEKLKKAGYTNVFNLYGGIFEWKNNNYTLYNLNQKETDSIHAFSKAWSKWLKKGIKVYE